MADFIGLPTPGLRTSHLILELETNLIIFPLHRWGKQKTRPSDFLRIRILSSNISLPVAHGCHSFLRLSALPKSGTCYGCKWCLVWKSQKASQVTDFPPDFINLAHTLFLLSSSKLQCSSPLASLPGPTVGPVILHSPRWSFLYLHDLLNCDPIRLEFPRIRTSLFCLQTEWAELSPASGRGSELPNFRSLKT